MLWYTNGNLLNSVLFISVFGSKQPSLLCSLTTPFVFQFTAVFFGDQGLRVIFGDFPYLLASSTVDLKNMLMLIHPEFI